MLRNSTANQTLQYLVISTVHLVVFIPYILTDCCVITCVHIFSSSAASVINKFSVQCSVCK